MTTSAHTTTQNTPETATVDFYGEELITVMVDGVLYVAVKPIIEAIGLNWGTQQEKLQRNSEKFSCTLMGITGKDGKQYKMLCIPINKLNGLLFTINPEKIPNLSTRKKVELYQEECFTALYDYWHSGIATNPRFAEVFPDLETFTFHGHKITTTLFDNIEYVSVESLIKGIGLDWEKHLKNFQDNEQEFYYKDLPIVGLEGGESALAAIPVTKIVHWIYDLDWEVMTVEQQANYNLFRAQLVDALRDFWRAKRVDMAGSEKVSNQLLQEELRNAEAVRMSLEARLRDVSKISPQELTLLFKAVTEGYWIVNRAALTYKELFENMTKAQRNLNEVTKLLRQVFPDAFNELDVMLLTTAKV